MMMLRTKLSGWVAGARLRLIAGVLMVVTGQALGQVADEAAAGTETLSGTVVNGATNQPVFRALVRLTGQAMPRAVLTDGSGHFSFPEVDPSRVTLTAMKPGYHFARNPNDPTQVHVKAEQVENPVELRLYPEALLTGTVVGPDGDPLARISVEALRATEDDLGRHWIATGVTRSNAKGEFRLPVAAGEYRVQTELSRAAGTSAVMPVSLPDGGEGGFRVRPGEEREVEIHPVLAPLVAVSARVNVPVEELSGLNGILADGTSFPVSFMATGPSTFTAKLPAGSYVLQTRYRGYGNGGSGADGLAQAALTLYPTAKQPVGLTLQFVPVASIPVEIELDDAAVAAATAAGQTLTAPNARTLSMALEPETLEPAIDAEYLRTSYRRGEAGVTFLVPPGTYRLRAQRNYTWYITSALYGGTEILGHELTVASGAGSTPLRITVSNQVATVTGTVKLNGAPAACWVYLVATTPTATPVLTLRSGEDGTLTQMIPPGSYRAVAFQSRQAPDAVELLEGHGDAAEVTATAGEKTTISLEAMADP